MISPCPNVLSPVSTTMSVAEITISSGEATPKGTIHRHPPPKALLGESAWANDLAQPPGDASWHEIYPLGVGQECQELAFQRSFTSVQHVKPIVCTWKNTLEINNDPTVSRKTRPKSSDSSVLQTRRVTPCGGTSKRFLQQPPRR